MFSDLRSCVQRKLFRMSGKSDHLITEAGDHTKEMKATVCALLSLRHGRSR